jgi:hypothetical protein
MEYINDLYEYIYENVYEMFYDNNYDFYGNYFKSEKPDIFEDINFDTMNIYTSINILNERKQNIDNYSIPKDFDVSDKLSILKYKLSFCLKTKKDMSDDMIKHIENYKYNTDKIKKDAEVDKIINEIIYEINDNIEMVNLENRYNKLKDDTDMVLLENRFNKLKEEIDENERNDENDNRNDGATGVLVKQKVIVKI